jgi:hypothetical protein
VFIFSRENPSRKKSEHEFPVLAKELRQATGRPPLPPKGTSLFSYIPGKMSIPAARIVRQNKRIGVARRTLARLQPAGARSLSFLQMILHNFFLFSQQFCVIMKLNRFPSTPPKKRHGAGEASRLPR